MKDLSWRGFEDLVYRIQSISFPNGTVTLDAKVVDVVTKRSRQVDIAIRIVNETATHLIAVECKKFQHRKVCQPHVEQFVSFLKSVGADKGIMVASVGYSSSAKIYAAAMDVDLFTIQEASGLEWQSHINAVSRPVIKKRITTGDILIYTPETTQHIRSKDLRNPLPKLQIFRREQDKIVSMTEYRKRHPEADFNFFMNMPDFRGHLLEMMEDRVETKLDTSKTREYENLIATVGGREKGLQGRIAHVFLDELEDMVRDTAAPLSWMAEVHAGKPLGGPFEELYIGSRDACAPFLGISLRYVAEISCARYCGNIELSERDVANGIAYVDIQKGKKRFFFLSELRSNKTTER